MMTLPPRRILLNPGPATTSDTVKQALLISDVCPRDPEFTALLAEVLRRLAAIVGDPAAYVAVPFPGSGTTAVEAALGSVVPPDGDLLIIDNGDYGARMAAIARALAIPHRVVAPGWGRPVDLDEVERALHASPAAGGYLAFAHHETSTGMLNPLEALAALARRRGVGVIVDAMSSLGGIPIDADTAGIDYLVSSANKCIQGMAGLSFVIASRRALEGLRGVPARSYSLDLRAQQESLERSGQTRFTTPPQVVSALRQALLELEAETVEGRRRRYDRCYAALVEGVRALGFEPLLPPQQESRILVALREPEAHWWAFEPTRAALAARGFTIYPGTSRAIPTFRLSVLGDLEVDDIHAFVDAFAEQLRATGHPGAAVLYEAEGEMARVS